MTVAGLCIPVSQSVNGLAGASKYVISRAAAIRIGKELVIDAGIDFVSSNVTSFAADQFNLNKTESTLLNLGLNLGLDKSVDSARSKISGEASFAEGMSYDDAKRYNDYWERVELGNNTGYPGLTDADIKLWKFADNKLNEHIALNKVNPNEVVKIRMKELELENSLRVVDKGASGADPKKLLNNTGKFNDEILETKYQDYLNRKLKRNKEPKNRLEWKDASDYWTKESPIARGNEYNKTVRNSDLYDYHEVYLSNGKRLDSYDPDVGEIISRKATDLDKISEDTYRKYLSEFNEKYSRGTEIRSNAYPELDGSKLNGRYILEIPATNASLRNIEYYKNIAKEYDVILRFREEIK